MKVKHQVISTVVATAILAVLCSILISYRVAENTARSNAKHQIEQSLISKRELTKQSIERYLNTIESQLLSLAVSPVIQQSATLSHICHRIMPLPLLLPRKCTARAN